MEAYIRLGQQAGARVGERKEPDCSLRVLVRRVVRAHYLVARWAEGSEALRRRLALTTLTCPRASGSTMCCCMRLIRGYSEKRERTC